MHTSDWHAGFLCDQQRLEGTDQWWLSPGEFSEWVGIKGPRGAEKATALYTQRLTLALGSIQSFLEGLGSLMQGRSETVLALKLGRVASANRWHTIWGSSAYILPPTEVMEWSNYEEFWEAMYGTKGGSPDDVAARIREETAPAPPGCFQTETIMGATRQLGKEDITP
jgi:hypothetical protein